MLTSNFPRWEGDSTTPFVLHLASDLQRCGWDIDVLVPSYLGAGKHATVDGVPTRRFRYAWPQSAETVFYDGGALTSLRSRRGESLKLPMVVMSEAFVAGRMLRSRHYDLVHSHWLLPQGFVGAGLSRLTNVPHITTVHGGDVFALQGRVLGSFKKLAIRGSDAITVNSSATERIVRDLADSGARVERMPMGADITSPDPTEIESVRRRHAPDGAPLIVFVGRLVAEKGVFDAIESFNLVHRDHPTARLVIAGDGPARADVEAAVDDAGLGDAVDLIGWVDPSRVTTLMAAADVVVAPSKAAPDGWVEAFGLVLVEAMAAGTPVVSTRIGGIPDVVVDGETGILVEAGDVSGLADAVDGLLRSDELAQSMGAAGRRRATSMFGREAAAERFSGLYSSLIRSEPGGGDDTE